MGKKSRVKVVETIEGVVEERGGVAAEEAEEGGVARTQFSPTLSLNKVQQRNWLKVEFNSEYTYSNWQNLDNFKCI